MEEEDISLLLSDDSSYEEKKKKKVSVIEDNNQIKRPEPILDDQIDAVEDIGQIKSILEEDGKEMVEEPLETVPEQAPGNVGGFQQQDQLDHAEIIEPILEKDEKDVVNEPLDTDLEDKKIVDKPLDILHHQAASNEGSNHQTDQDEAIDIIEPILEEDDKEIVEEPFDSNPEQSQDNYEGDKKETIETVSVDILKEQIDNPGVNENDQAPGPQAPSYQENNIDNPSKTIPCLTATAHGYGLGLRPRQRLGKPKRGEGTPRTPRDPKGRPIGLRKAPKRHLQRFPKGTKTPKGKSMQPQSRQQLHRYDSQTTLRRKRYRPCGMRGALE